MICGYGVAGLLIARGGLIFKLDLKESWLLAWIAPPCWPGTPCFRNMASADYEEEVALHHRLKFGVS